MPSPFRVIFQHNQQESRIATGDSYAAPKAEGFRDTPAGELRDIIARVEGGQLWREVVLTRYGTLNPWLHRIITDPTRTAFFDSVLPPGSGPVLDIGAGWGQISRPLAMQRPVVAVEPVAERVAFIRAAARQDGVQDQIAYLEADYLELKFSTRFEAICAIGVLEWAGAFQNETDPQERQRQFLRKARGELIDGGSLILGIENRLGLKYLLGCPDDHLGVPHIGYLPASLARRRWAAEGHTLQSFTYSQAELETMLRVAGFTRIEYYAAFPDYKLPSRIVPLGDDGRTLHDWLIKEGPPPDHNGYDGHALDPVLRENITAMYRSLAAEGLARYFVPSFFIRAS